MPLPDGRPAPAAGLDDEVGDTAVVTDLARVLAGLQPTPGTAAQPGPERRRCPRRAVARRVGAVVRKGATGLGRDLGIDLADAAEEGLGLRLRAPMSAGDEAAVELSRPGVSRPLVLAGEVRWCRPDADGTYRAGVRLRRRLSYPELTNLIG